MLPACLPSRRLSPLPMSLQEASQAEAGQRMGGLGHSMSTMSCVAACSRFLARGVSLSRCMLAGGPGGGGGAGPGRPGAQHQQHVLRQRGARADGAPAQRQRRQQPPPHEYRRGPFLESPLGCEGLGFQGFRTHQLSGNAGNSPHLINTGAASSSTPLGCTVPYRMAVRLQSFLDAVGCKWLPIIADKLGLVYFAAASCILLPSTPLQHIMLPN